MYEALCAYDRAVARGMSPSVALYYLAQYCPLSWARALLVEP